LIGFIFERGKSEFEGLNLILGSFGKREKWIWRFKFDFVMLEGSRLVLIWFIFERGKSDSDGLNLIFACLKVPD
jgi:hypothetical protein